MIKLAWGEKPLKFIHIAKTGGTSIEDWGKENGYSWGRFDPDMAHGGKNHYPFIFRDASLQSMNDWFVVVRNPFTRVVSPKRPSAIWSQWALFSSRVTSVD